MTFCRNQFWLKRFGYQLLEFFHARQFVHILQPKPHQEFFRCLIKNRTANDLLAPRSRDQLSVEQCANHAAGIDTANVIDLGNGDRLLVSNYGESFDRNLGKESKLKLERGLNGLWTKGGLMYAMPIR